VSREIDWFNITHVVETVNLFDWFNTSPTWESAYPAGKWIIRSRRAFQPRFALSRPIEKGRTAEKATAVLEFLEA
jgi:hypothetical protein